MIQLGSKLGACDKSSVVSVQCIKVLYSNKKRVSKLGGLILICIHKVNTSKYVAMKARLQKRFSLGSIHRALLVRTRSNYNRTYGIHLKFDENTIVIVTRTVVPLSNKVYGPILREFCMR